jgi:aspartyl-tRNA synthetase
MENSGGYVSIEQAGCPVGAKVKVSGIVKGIQNHGGLLFISIKDGSYLIKALVIPDNEYAYAMARKTEKGFLVGIEGVVKECPASARSTASERKEIEIEVERMSIISARDDEEENRLVGILAKINTRNGKKTKKKIV